MICVYLLILFATRVGLFGSPYVVFEENQNFHTKRFVCTFRCFSSSAGRTTSHVAFLCTYKYICIYVYIYVYVYIYLDTHVIICFVYLDL